MNEHPDTQKPLPVLKFCNKSKPPNPILGDGPLGGEHNKNAELIKNLQKILIALGYLDTTDLGKDGPGKFGAETEKAVKRFQEEDKDWEGNSLKVDGLVGPKTADALNRALVGVLHEVYETPKELTKDKDTLLVTTTKDELKKGITLDPQDVKKAKVVLAEPGPKPSDVEQDLWAKKDENDKSCAKSGYKVAYQQQNGNYVQWILDGAKAMYEMCDAFIRATTFIYIIASYFSPGINLVRGNDYKKIYDKYKSTKYKNTLDNVRKKNIEKGANEDRIPLVSLLAVKAEEGVNVRIVMFHPDVAQDFMGGPFGWERAFRIVREWSKKIDVRLAMWGGSYEGHEIGGHHQKSAVVGTDEGLMGFCGGVDLAFARWALPSHSLTMGEKYPLVVLPGIMGSEMRKGSEVIWPSLSAKNLKRLAINDDGTDVETGITVGDILWDFHGEGYKKLVEFFGENGYKEGDLLFTHPYDWRKHLKQAADGLAVKVNDGLIKKSASKVIIVAHSMGGLVSRYCAATGNADKIRRLIQLGTPNHGSPKAYMMLKFGKEGPIPWYVPGGPDEADYRLATKNMQGAYHLLPDAKFFSLYMGENGGVFQKGTSYTNPTDAYLNGSAQLPNIALVKEAMDTSSNVLGDESHCTDTHLFIGHKIDTIGRVEVDPKAPTKPNTSDTSGDKTVPLKSVEYLSDVYNKKGTNLHYYVDVEHGKLVQNRNVLQEVLATVEDARIGGDPLDIPTRIDEPLKIDDQVGWIETDKVLGEWDGKEYRTKGSQVLWHDVHAKVVGPAAFDLANNFVERYERAGSSYQQNPVKSDLKNEIALYKNQSGVSSDLPSSTEGYSRGKVWAQIVRSYYPADDYGIWDAYRKLLGKARKNIYIESQYAFEDEELLNILIDNIKKNKELKVIIVAPLMPDSYDSDVIKNLRKLVKESLADPKDFSTARVVAFSLASMFGSRRIPIYVHAKIALVDDEWAIVGSANLDRMGMGGKGGGWGSRGSSELCILVHGVDQSLALRRMLAEEHLGSAASDLDFDAVFSRFIKAASENGRPKDNGTLIGHLVFHRLYKDV